MIKTLKYINAFFIQLPGIKQVTYGYLFYIGIGWLLLCLPWSQVKNDVSPLDNLFVSASAISTTGLSPVSVSDSYTFFGQLVVLALIQFGGIGYMTVGSFIILIRKQSLPESRVDVSQKVFSLPAGFKMEKFIFSVIYFTLLIELVGAVALYYVFQTLQAPLPLWSAVFHSVSSFCTAGFGLYNNSFESYGGSVRLNAVIAALSYAGAIGFIVFVDIWRCVKGSVKSITLTSKIILHATFWISIIGTILLFVAEPSFQTLPAEKRWLASFFQAMTAMTTVGFNTMPIGMLSKASLLLIIILMVIGASPSGTGGGLKSTTFSAIIGIMKSAIRGSSEVTFWGRAIPIDRLMTATATLGFYSALLITGVYLLSLTESFKFEEIFFEAASALGTVGLSTGITASLSHLGKLIIIFLMYAGRLGALTFGMAFFLRDRSFQSIEEDLAV
ncbi:MAG: potassium transporter TrkG [Candidatus Omnitrophota bacterium]